MDLVTKTKKRQVSSYTRSRESSFNLIFFPPQLCTNKSMKLENLATVMTLYSRRTFSKESFQWTKCVVKYLYDAYSHLSHNMLAFLVEVSDFF